MKLQRVSFKDQVYAYLKQAIVKGELKPGEIYSEQMFADRLSISRTPVREAVLQLKHENMLEIYNNRGIGVKPLLFDDARQIIQTRTAIEGYSIRYLAQRIADEEAQQVLQQLEECLEQEKAFTDQNCDIYEFMQSDVDFHGIIVRFAKNEYFIKTIDMMRARLEQATISSLQFKNRNAAALKEHWAILKCIRSGKADDAYAAFEQHMKITEDIMRKCNLG